MPPIVDEHLAFSFFALDDDARHDTTFWTMARHFLEFSENYLTGKKRVRGGVSFFLVSLFFLLRSTGRGLMIGIGRGGVSFEGVLEVAMLFPFLSLF